MCTPYAGIPDPKEHKQGSEIHGEVHRKQTPRRPTFYSPLLHQISFKAQNPELITFRDVVWTVWALYSLYQGAWTLAAIYKLLAQDAVRVTCYGTMSALGCLQTYSWTLVWIVGGWALGKVMPWGLVAAVVAFFGDEALRIWRSR